MTFCRKTAVRVYSLLLLVLALPIQAQDCANPNSTMLWQVENAGHPVYLFGSIHVGKPEFYPLPDVVETLFSSVENLVFEVDPTVLENPMTALQLQARGMYGDGETLAEHLSPETMNRLKQFLADNGLPLESVLRMKPWFMTTLISGLEVLKLGFQAEFGIENYIMTRKSDEAAILELESLEEQLGYLESLNSEQFLAYTLDSVGLEGQEMLQQMIAAWKCADHEELEHVLFSDFEDPAMSEALRAEMEALQELMFYKRNEDMAEGITELIENGEGSYLVVVGSGHLLGEGSVIDLLEDAGYQIGTISSQ